MVKARNASLPEEVVEEILMNLPVKSLKRFRCVCKSWLSSIDSSDFVKMHYRNSRNLNALVMSMPDLGSQVESKVQISLLCSETMLVGEKLYSPFCEIIGESHGLVLLVDDSEAGLLNPATNEFKLILQSTDPQPDPYQYTWGFGYDKSSHDYKIMRFRIRYFVDTATDVRIDLYSLNASSWREIRYPFELMPRPLQSGIYVNGRCHWWLVRGKTILAFDMAEESFHIMDFFLGDDFDPYCHLKLRVFDNCLACSVKSIVDFGCFEIWVMKDYEVKDSWIKELVIGPIAQVAELLEMWKTGEWFFVTRLDQLAMYNPQSMAVRHLGMQRLRYTGFQTVIYTESLYSLNGTYLNPIYDSVVHHPKIMDPLEESRNV